MDLTQIFDAAKAAEIETVKNELARAFVEIEKLRARVMDLELTQRPVAPLNAGLPHEVV